ncbi:helical backbone metal receptor [Sinimarinibacterium thermocellulolyticum]|uniref:Helical backbone metal receptor n=1 Tax=Sinimarinibacterium thermocellulolyticum TaxID=3170016 RepID=A0ABV2A6N6_9GAMM
MRWLRGLLLVLCCAGAHASERIVALAPHLAELTCAVGACERLVGVVAYTDAPAQAARLPQVGDAYGVNLEALLRLQPDLVLAWDGGTPAAVIERLRGLGLAVETVAIRDLDGIGAAMVRIGERIDAPDTARAAADYRRRLHELRARYRDRRRLRAFYQTETAPAFSINRRSPIHEALSLCGAKNVFADLPALAAAVSLEAVIAARPEVVVHTQQEDQQAMARYWARLPQLPPSDPRRRVVVDGNTLTRQSPRMLDGIAELCEGLDRVRALEPFNAAK